MGRGIVLLVCVLCMALNASGATLQVGPTRTLTLPSQAAALAQDGDIIEIDAGTYTGDAAAWTKNNLTIRGVGGRAIIISNGASINGWGIWVPQGLNTTIEHVTLSGCHGDGTCGGIRLQGKTLTLRDVILSSNDHGILTDNETGTRTSDVLIEDSESFNNGTGDGQNHNIYVSQVRSLIVRRSYIHDSIGGQGVKSRALTTTLEYNMLKDAPQGTTNYEVDISCGGTAILKGNVIQQDVNTSNPVIVTFDPEIGSIDCPATGQPNVLTLVNNTLVGDRSPSYFVFAKGAPTFTMVNNLLVGDGPAVTIDGIQLALPVGNIQTLTPVFVEQARQDYHLADGSPAIDAGIALPFGVTIDRQPEYPPPLTIARTVVGAALDTGAYEFGLAFTPLPPPPPPPPPPVPPRVVTTPPIPADAGWYQLAGTDIKQADPCPALNCEYEGAEGQSAVISDWVSGAFDTLRNRMIIGPGGGHQGYFGNEVYAIDLDTFAVTRLTDPTPLPVDFFAVNCYEFFSTVGGPVPAARHTYDNQMYLPALDVVWQYGAATCRNGGGILNQWALHFSPVSWEQETFPPPPPTQNDFPDSPQTAINVTGYDP